LIQVLDSRSVQKEALPLSWVKRTLCVVYTDSDRDSVETTAALLDTCPAGPILGIDGAKTLIAWNRLVLRELQED
jgi:hypothetical protein